MGSTGSGRFTDYEGYSSSSSKQGGYSRDDECGKAFRTELEDVDISQYYVSKRALPPVNSQVLISSNNYRIVAVVDGLETGNLPTKYNYLRACINNRNYSGIISNISSVPINTIIINIEPNE